MTYTMTAIELVENDIVCRIDAVSLVVSAFISVKFDFDQRNTFLLIGLARVMVAGTSRRIAVWSLTPTTSSVRFASDGRIVKTGSRQFPPACLHVLFGLGLGPLSCSGKGIAGVLLVRIRTNSLGDYTFE